MAWVGLVIMAVGVIAEGSAQKKSEKAIRESNFRRAAQLEDKAEQAIAASQRVMLEERRQNELIASRALAVSAASGADAMSVDVVNIIADIKGEGAYNESVALYQGEQEARDLRAEAKNLRAGVRALESAGKAKRTATFIRGASSVYGAYSKAYPSGGAAAAGYR